MSSHRKSDMVKLVEKHLGDIHSAAAVGFGRAADAYERGRPEYPVEAIEFISNRLVEFGSKRNQGMNGETDALTIVDLAAGTGKFTKVLAALDVSLVGEIIAVEPVAEMRTKLESLLGIAKEKSVESPAAPRVKVQRESTALTWVDVTPESPAAPRVKAQGVRISAVEGTAEKIPLANESCDVITVAQAFHWFDGARALPEIHRVLKPGGMLIALWNVRDESHAWVREMTDLMVPYEGNAPRYRSFKWKQAFDQSTLFAPLVLTKFSNLTIGTMDTMLDRVASVSFVASLPELERTELLNRMRELYGRQLQSNVENDASASLTSGRIEMPYETHIFISYRK